MKLWYQSLARHDRFQSYAKVLREIIEKVAEPETEIDVHAVTRSGGIADQYYFFGFLDMRDVVSNFIRAEAEGYDAFLIGNIGDPGLYEGREMTRFPVLGLCETSLHLACMMGHKFGLVTVNEKFTPRILENVERYGLAKRLGGVHFMKVDRLLSLDEAYNDKKKRDRLFDQFFDAAEKTAKQGAEVIIPAGGVVMALLAHAGLYRVGDVPILNGITALIKMGEMAVRLNKIMGGFTSKRSTFAPPPPHVLEEIKQAYGSNFSELPFTRCDKEP